MMPMLNKFL